MDVMVFCKWGWHVVGAANQDAADIIHEEGCPQCWVRWETDAKRLLGSIDWKEDGYYDDVQGSAGVAGFC